MTPREPEEKEIGGVRYRVRYLTTTKAQAMLATLSKMLLPAFAALVNPGAAKDIKGTAELGSLMSKLGPDVLQRAAAELVGRLDSETVARVLKDLAGITSFAAAKEDGTEVWLELGPQYDLHFMGRNKAWVGWVQFALEVQFGDFFA